MGHRLGSTPYAKTSEAYEFDPFDGRYGLYSYEVGPHAVQEEQGVG